jgi:hypothetical protein
MDLSTDMLDALAVRIVDELEARGLVEPKEKDLVSVQKLAEEEGVSRSTVYRRLERYGIPRRDVTGKPKTEGDKRTTFVSRAEWRSAGALSTRQVRRADGHYD